MTAPATALRAVVLGLSHPHLQYYLAFIAAEPILELVGLHEVSGSPQDDPVLAGGVPLVEALADADLAIICAATDDHGRLVPAVLSAGVPTLIEKPLAATPHEVAELAGALRRAAVPATTAMFLRCSTALRRVRELLAAGACGRLSALTIRFNHAGLLDGAFAGPAAWMAHGSRGAHGGLADLGIHILDLLRWLAPEAPITIYATRPLYRAGLRPDVGGAVLMDWGDVPTVVQVGWASRPGGFWLCAEGERATITMQGGDVSMTGDRGRVERHPPPAASDALGAFVAQLRGEETWEPATPADMVACAWHLDELRRAQATVWRSGSAR